MKKALDRLEVLNKFADRISYNFLCFSGWVVFVVSCFCFWPYMYEVHVVGHGSAGMAPFFGFILLCTCGLLFFFIGLLIGVLEYFYGWRIKNNFFLNNGFMKFLRYFGIVCIALMWLAFAFFIVTSLLDSIFFGVPEYS